jgi:hypothetical protein
MNDKKHKFSPPSKPAKHAFDFTAIHESFPPMGEPKASKRAPDPQDEDDRALKHTKFISEPPPSTPISSTLPNPKRSLEAEDD